MKKRLQALRNTVIVLWRMLPKALRVLIILFALVFAIIIATSPQPAAWFLPCLLMLVVATISGTIIYRLLFR